MRSTAGCTHFDQLRNGNGQTAEGLRELALFAGAGGGILGGHLLGWRTVCAVEWEPYPAGVLIARQNEGILPPFPIWDDVRTFDGKPWRGLVDVVSGGFPCQDISAAGKGKGIDGERSGMWKEMARIIGEVRPRYVLVENSPVLTSRGLGRVLGDLAELGYDAEWCVLGADDAGAPHHRERIWILAHTNSDVPGMHAGPVAKETGFFRRHAEGHLPSGCGSLLAGQVWHTPRDAAGRRLEPDVPRVVNGMADRLVALKASGNGQVPVVAALAWNTLYNRIANR